MPQKIACCPQCGLVKIGNEDQFHRAVNKRLGLSTYCKACASKRNRGYAARDKETGRKQKLAPYCITCKLPKDENENSFHKNQASADGLNSECKQCVAKRNKQYCKTHKREKRDYFLRYNYGITLDDFETMLQGQNHQCALCGTTEPGGKGTFHVDHCHETGKIRALLCHFCNIMLGHAKEDPELLEKAAAYIRKHGDTCN